jgi:hypothetical protein
VAAIHCRCIQTHDGDGGNFGCGASWLIAATNVTPQADTHLYALTPEREAKFWPAAEAVAAQTDSVLTTVQGTAKTIQTGLAAVIALLGVGAVFTSRDTLQKLSGGDRAWIVGLAAASVLADAVFVGLLLLAQVAFPWVKKAATSNELIAADLDPLRLARGAAQRTQMGTVAAILAFILAAISLIVLVSVSDADANDTHLNVTTVAPDGKSTTATCGVIPKDQPTPAIGSPGAIDIQPSGAPSPTPIPLRSVLGIAPGPCKS